MPRPGENNDDTLDESVVVVEHQDQRTVEVQTSSGEENSNEDSDESVDENSDSEKSGTDTDTMGIIPVEAIEVFSANSADWDVYKKRLRSIFTNYGVTDPKKMASYVLMKLDQETFRLLNNMCFPEDITAKPYDEIVKMLDQLYGRKVSVFAERVKFYELHQMEGEKVNEFHCRIRGAAATCEFGDNLLFAIRDKFITGLQKGPILDRLMEEKADIKMDEALVIAERKELQQQEVKCMNYVGRNPMSKGRKLSAIVCKVCGMKNHRSEDCFYKDRKCDICHCKGHLKAVCRKKSNERKYRNNFITDGAKDEDDEASDNGECSTGALTLSHLNMKPYMLSLDSRDKNPIFRAVRMNGHTLQFELDTGSPVSCMSMELYRRVFGQRELELTDLTLFGYTGEKIRPDGKLQVQAQVEGVAMDLELYVMTGGGPPLLGRDYVRKANLMLNMNTDGALQRILEKYPRLFDGEPGCYQYGKVELRLKSNACPVFRRPRQIAHSLRGKVDAQLESLEKNGTITRITTSDWGTPLVPILKADGTVRICGDYKVTLNRFLEDCKHPIPRIDDLLCQLQGGYKFSKIDLRDAYNQLELSDESKQICSWSTHRGIYQVNKMPFGITPGTSIFQGIIEQLLQGIEGVVVFIDDIMVTGKKGTTDKEKLENHLENVEKVLQILSDAGLKVKKEKCEFLRDQVTYLGFTIDHHGLHKSMQMEQKIINLDEPKNVHEVRRLMGIVTFYSRFIPHMATIMAPIYALTRSKGNRGKFVWTEDCRAAWTKVVKTIKGDLALAHFDQRLPTIIETDASDVGVGAVLLQRQPDGLERPCYFVSRALTDTERGYSVIDKEALGVVYALKKFYPYVYGTKFVIRTDHRPLLGILGENKEIPVFSSRRMQRWALSMAAFDYKMEYIKGATNHLADHLSRNPNLEKEQQTEDEEEEAACVHYIEGAGVSIVSADELKEVTEKDEVLQKVRQYIFNGWPRKLSSGAELKRYFAVREKLCYSKGLILHGDRLVVPALLRNRILNELHQSHQGEVKTKSFARQFVWWPTINNDIHQLVADCRACSQFRSSPPKTSSPWPETKHAFERIHLDFAGPIRGRYLLILVDSFTKWIEVFVMTRITTEATIKCLRSTFARFGLPVLIVSDNGPQFTASEFRSFLQVNGIKQMTSPVAHPQSNGAAENAVKTVKLALEKILATEGDMMIEDAIVNFLMAYRNTPHCTTQETPSHRMFGRKVNLRLDLVKEGARSIPYPPTSADGHRFKARREIAVGEEVLALDMRVPNKKRFVRGTVQKRIGRVVYLVLTEEQQLWKRHINQLYKLSSGHMCDPAQPVSGSPADSSMVPRRSKRIEQRMERLKDCK